MAAGGVDGQVRLRGVVDDDLAAFLAMDQDPVANHMAAFTRQDPTDPAAFAAHWARIRKDATISLRTVLVGDEVVGNVASYVLFGERQVTYGVARGHWGRGVATEALRQLLREVVERPLHARAARDNLGSLRVLEKCGFEVCGEDRGFANARGVEIDEVVLRLA